MCLYPTLIRNRKYLKNKKNGGNIPPITDKRVMWVPVGCQKCIECRKQKAREWQARLLEDIKKHKNGKFITFTFSNESIAKLIKLIRIDEANNNQHYELTGYDLDNQIATKAMRLFLERWRKEFGTSLRHWTVTELGHQGTENIHIHGIIWTNEPLTMVEAKWQYGYVWKGDEQLKTNYVNDSTVNYIVKYIHKIDIDHKFYKSKILTSSGIGHNYAQSQDIKINKFKGLDTQETYRTKTGHKLSLPIYWRNKIYTEKQREQLWLQKLDKQERWICGTKVDISKTEKHYYELLKFHRERNRKLGYGDDQGTWEQEQYEQERRHLLQLQRIKNTETGIALAGQAVKHEYRLNRGRIENSTKPKGSNSVQSEIEYIQTKYGHIDHEFLKSLWSRN